MEQIPGRAERENEEEGKHKFWRDGERVGGELSTTGVEEAMRKRGTTWGSERSYERKGKKKKIYVRKRIIRRTWRGEGSDREDVRRERKKK